MFSKLVDILNDLRPKQLLIISAFIALIMFVIAYGVLTLLSKPDPSEVQIKTVKPIENTVTVVAASMDIAPRTIIKENMVQLKEVSAELVPEGAIKDVAEVLNAPARSDIFNGDVITEQKIYKSIAQAGFVGSIPADCRAVSINVSDVTGVAGFAKPGDYVDLMLVEKDKNSATTSVLLQNILLLSINQSMTNNDNKKDNDNETANTSAIENPSIATFALKPDEALQLISASKLGEIYLMLRPFNPKDMYVDEYDYTMNSINAPPVASRNYNSAPPATSSPAVPAQKANVPPLPVVPSANSTPVSSNGQTKNFEIIQGDKIIQGSDNRK